MDEAHGRDCVVILYKWILLFRHAAGALTLLIIPRSILVPDTVVVLYAWFLFCGLQV